MQGTEPQGAQGPSVTRRAVDIAVGAIALLVGVVVMVDTYRLGAGWAGGSPQPGYFPFRIGIFISLAAAVIVVRALARGRTAAPEAFVTWSRFRLVLAVLVPTIVYVLAIQLAGIYVASALFIAGFMLASRDFGWLKTAVVSIGIAGALFWLFEIQFLLPLPKGPLEAWLGY